MMPRIRTIKPEFWTDGAVVKLSPMARLLFIGTWNFACDRGHVPGDLDRLKLQIFPADDVDISQLVDELVDHGLVSRETSNDDRSYVRIVRFDDHQRIDSRWKSTCKFCDQGIQPASLARDTSSLAESPNVSRQDRKGSKNNKDHSLNDQASDDRQPALIETSRPASTKRRRRAKVEADPRFDEFWKIYPRKVVKARAVKAWQAAIKKAPADKIIAAARSYAAQHDKTETRFIAHPSSWLNAERWEDPDEDQITSDEPEWEHRR